MQQKRRSLPAWSCALLLVTLCQAGLLLAGCGAGGNVVNAALNTGVALGVAQHQRQQGGCYAACAAGTVCNEETGYCDPLPCKGLCAPNEICRQAPSGERCEPAGELDLWISRGRP